ERENPPECKKDRREREDHERRPECRADALLPLLRCDADGDSCRGIADITHMLSSLRTDGCQNNVFFSTTRAPTFTSTPRKPATTISAYMSGTAPDDCATKICC